MPKAILQFNLPEERHEFEVASNGQNYLSALHDLDNYLRSKLKYEELPDQVREALQSTRDELHVILLDNGVEI